MTPTHTYRCRLNVPILYFMSSLYCLYTIFSIIDFVTGYQGDGVTCRFVGVCHIDNGGCHQLASCSETPGESSDTFSVHGFVA